MVGDLSALAVLGAIVAATGALIVLALAMARFLDRH